MTIGLEGPNWNIIFEKREEFFEEKNMSSMPLFALPYMFYWFASFDVIIA
jgi:hypothetical protein